MDPSLGRGEHPRQRRHTGSDAGRPPSRRAVVLPTTKHVVPTALRRGRLPQLQELHPGAGERHSCPHRPRWVLRRLGHEESMAAPVFGRLGGSQSDAEFHEAVEEANELHATGALFARQMEPEPAPEDPVDLAMAEASDDEDDAPVPDAPPEPEIIDMPPAPASARPMSNLERCIALRLLYGAGPRRVSEKMSRMSVLLSALPRLPDKKVSFLGRGRGRRGRGVRRRGATASNGDDTK